MGHEKVKIRESVGRCFICNTELFRDEFEKWVYHTSIGLACKRHPGVIKWYDELIAKTRQELIDQGVIPNQPELKGNE